MTPYAPQLWRKKMANRDSTTNEQASTIATGPYHEDFSWLPDNIKFDRSASFAARVRTIASGCSAIASVARQHMLDSSNGERTLLGENHMDSLIGLVQPLLDMLDDAASDQIHHLAEVASAAAKKGGAK
jgi:hypothetical protein